MWPPWTWTCADAVVVALLLVPDVARAGACCAGPTTSVPSRLRKDEVVGAGTAFTGGGTVARWDTAGRVTPASPGEARITADVFVGWRWDAKGQLALTVPGVVQHAGSGASGEWGVGAGDTRLTVLWEPATELRGAPGKARVPVPMIAFGVRAPTGRAFEDSRQPLRTDATGEGDPGLLASVQLERTVDAVPWAIAVGTEIGIGSRGPRPSLDVSAGVGRSFDAHWSIYASAAHHERWIDGARTARTTVGLRAQHAWPGIGRIWCGVLADLGAPALGVDLPVEVKGTIGFAWAR